MTSTPPPGWYPDPSGMPSMRWWDGNSWSELSQPPPPVVGPKQHRWRWLPRRWWQWAIVATIVLVVSAGGTYLGGFGSTSSTGGIATWLPPVGTGFLATGPSFVDFIQWNDNNGNLSGTAQTVIVQGSPPNASTESA